MRLIDANEFKKRIDHYPAEIRDIAKKELRYVPTIDAVQVVRCKDCKYSKYKQGELRCYIWSISSKTKEDGYCFCGARMVNENEDAD